MLRIPVISSKGICLMPTKASRAAKFILQKKAIGKRNKLGMFYIQLTFEPKTYKVWAVKPTFFRGGMTTPSFPS